MGSHDSHRKSLSHSGQTSGSGGIAPGRNSEKSGCLATLSRFGESVRGRRKVSEAEGVLQKLRDQMPKSPDAAIALGDYYLRKNDSEKALTEYRRGLSESAGNLEIEERIQGLYLSSNQIEQAAKLDSQLTAQAPKDTLSAYCMGGFCSLRGKSRTPSSLYKRQLKTPPIPPWLTFIWASHTGKTKI